MLDILSEGFKKATEKFQGKATLSEENIADAIKDIRLSLLDADVEYTVAKAFLERVKQKALGIQVNLRASTGKEKVKVNAGDHFVKICLTELEALMGPVDTQLKLDAKPAIIMMLGLQGVGKTTTTAKLARYLQRKKKKPLLVAADIYRPAAVNQLKVLGERLGAPVFHEAGISPVKICQLAKAKAMELGCDVILLDTAGRLTIDEALMTELTDIKAQVKPDNILLVCDAMMGQDAVTTAKSFHEQLDLDGVIMTKLDGDARGGAALSIKEVIGKPIKFLGMGEDLDRLEEFRPEGLASRILGMGDIVGLMEDYERVAEGAKEEDAERMLSGQFTFKDFYEQLSTIQKMGSFKDIVAKLPLQNMIPPGANVDDSELVKAKSMIDSMTPRERLYPDILNQSRLKRVARGSGRSTNDVAALVKKFKAMRTIMAGVGKNMGLLSKLPGMNTLSQMNQLRKMAVSGPEEMMQRVEQAGLGAELGSSLRSGGLLKRVDRDKMKKARKLAKKNKAKNRKK